MSVVLDKEIYQWLLALEAIKVSTYAKELENGKIELDPAITSYFSSGLVFSKLLHQIVKTLPKNTTPDPPNLKSLDTMKFSQTAASKIYNWNVVLESLKKLEVNVDNDIKNLIINGDLDMVNDLLKEVHTHFHRHEHRGDISMALKVTKLFCRTQFLSHMNQRILPFNPLERLLTSAETKESF